jgi:hypothetical protein
METSREFVIGPGDLDRISVRCKSCTAELLLPMWKLALGETAERDIKKQDLPDTCPSCGDDWTQLYGAMKDFRAALVRVKEYSVSFRVPAPEEKREGVK